MIRPTLRGALALAALASFIPPASAANAPAPPQADPKCLASYQAVGLPRENSDDNDAKQVVLCRMGYALSFNTDTRNPDWAIEHLTKASMTKKVARQDAFQEDPDLKKVQPGMSAVLPDYAGQTVYQRGHQAPAEDFAYSRDAMNQSFYLSNMSPQWGTLNGGLWSRIENEARQWVKCDKADELYVITGPVYGGATKRLAAPRQNKDIKTAADAHRVLVPDYYYKIVYDPVAHQSVAFQVPNQSVNGHKMQEYITTIQAIEDATGITFLSGLGARGQRQQEGVKGTLWGHDSC
ncbi:MAG: DNA/RNA non-specific endonuclease [Rhizomicrobium sp.]